MPKDKQRELTNKLINSAIEYINFMDKLRNEGLLFEKRVKRFSKASAAIYLPKRLIGKLFRVILMPVDDGYELSGRLTGGFDEAESELIKDTEKQLNEIQNDRRKLIELK
jgi:putative transposon-encoded protein